MTVLLCCSVANNLKVFDSAYVQEAFKIGFKCPCCGTETPKFIALESQLFQQLITLEQPHIKWLLSDPFSTPENIFDNIKKIVAIIPQKRGLYLFLLDNKLSIEKYLDDDHLSSKLSLLLKESPKIKPDVMLLVLEKFLAAGADMNTTSKAGWTALQFICRFWPEQKVPTDIVLKVLELMLAKGADVNMANHDGWTALQIICRYWPEAKVPADIALKALELILAKGADVNMANHDGWTALQIICRYWPEAKVPADIALKALELILAKGADVNMANHDGLSALQFTCHYWPKAKVPGDILLKALEILLAKSADVNAANKEGWTALQVICHHWPEAKTPGDILLKALEMILAKGADVNAADEEGWTALQIICRYWSEAKIPGDILLKALEMILVKGADVNASDGNNWTVLHFVCRYWTNAPVDILIKAVELLLIKGADVNTANKGGYICLHYVSWHWVEAKVPASVLFNTVELLLNEGADVNAADRDGCSILHNVSWYWPAKVPTDVLLKTLELLLAKGANVNAADKNGWTALHYICRFWPNAGIPASSIVKALKLLLNKDNINAVNEHGSTALHFLCYSELNANVPLEITLNAVNLFLEMGANTHLVDKDGRIALYFDNQDRLKTKISEKIILKISEKLLTSSVQYEEALPDLNALFNLLENNSERLEINFQLFMKYMQPQIDREDADTLSKRKTGPHSETLFLQQFESQVMQTTDYRYPLIAARLYQKANFFVKDRQKIFNYYQKVVEILLVPKPDLVLKKEELEALTEVKNYDHKILSPHLLNGFILVGTASHQYACDSFLKAAETGWLFGYIMLAREYINGPKQEAAKDPDKAIKLYEKILFSNVADKNIVNQECIKFAFSNILQFAQIGNILALKILRVYYNKLGMRFEGKTSEAVFCYCKAIKTSYGSQIKEAILGLTEIAAFIKNDKKSCIEMISSLADYLTKNSQSQIPHNELMVLVKKLDIEKLFLHASPSSQASTLILFAHKLLPQRLVADYANIFCLLVEKGVEDVCKSILELSKEKADRIIQFFQQLLTNVKLPSYLFDAEVRKLIESFLNVNLIANQCEQQSLHLNLH